MAFSDDTTILALIAKIGASDPVISSADPSYVAAILDAIKGTLNEDLGDYALALAVCHELTLGARAASGGVGPVISEKEGELARTYANLNANLNSYWSSTSYGMRFWALASRLLVTFGNRMTFGRDTILPACGDDF